MSLFDIDADTARAVIMVVLIVAFLGMWAWAWSSKRKKTFHEASMLPLEEDDGTVPAVNLRKSDSKGKDKQDGIEE